MWLVVVGWWEVLGGCGYPCHGGGGWVVLVSPYMGWWLVVLLAPCYLYLGGGAWLVGVGVCWWVGLWWLAWCGQR